MTGAFFGSPSEDFRGAAQVGVAVQAGWTTAAAGLEIGFDAPGGLGEWPGSFRARGAVVGQRLLQQQPAGLGDQPRSVSGHHDLGTAGGKLHLESASRTGAERTLDKPSPSS
jgi:hypothetical protein